MTYLPNTHTQDGDDVAQGSTADDAVQGDAAGTVSEKLRGLNKLWGTNADSAATADTDPTVMAVLQAMRVVLGDILTALATGGVGDMTDITAADGAIATIGYKSDPALGGDVAATVEARLAYLSIQAAAIAGLLATISANLPENTGALPVVFDPSQGPVAVSGVYHTTAPILSVDGTARQFLLDGANNVMVNIAAPLSSGTDSIKAVKAGYASGQLTAVSAGLLIQTGAGVVGEFFIVGTTGEIKVYDAISLTGSPTPRFTMTSPAVGLSLIHDMAFTTGLFLVSNSTNANIFYSWRTY